MEWTPTKVSRLYDLYRQHFDRLRADVCQANVLLGSPEPGKTKLQMLSAIEFRGLFVNVAELSEPMRLWVLRIISGHENEFPEVTREPMLRARVRR